jgi:GAF domain-containing protein
MTDLSTALLQAARDISPDLDLQATLQACVDAATAAFPEIDHAGISIAHRDGQIETVAASGPLVGRLDQLQYDAGEGPCLFALTDEPVVTVQYAAHEQRWPRFMPAAIAEGLRSQIGLRLFTEKRLLGGLNLYSTSTDTISAETVRMAELFAAHATLAMGRAQREEHLHSAIASRQLIGQATGIVMERYSMNETRAFDYLLRVSSLSNIKLRTLARELVEAFSQPPADDVVP